MNFCYTGRADTSAPAQGKIIEGAEPMATMNSLTDIWSVVMDSLSQELTQTAINTWFSDCTPIEINNNTLIVHTTSDFKRSIIQSRFEKTICAVLYDLFSCPFELVVLAGDDELLEYREKRPSSEEMPEMDGYTFDRFIVGPSNKFAHAAAIAVSQNPGKAYNPLLIYGNSGLGKTHLLLAIGQTIRHNNPSAKIAYVKGEEFVNQMVKSIGTGTAESWAAQYKVLLDEVRELQPDAIIFLQAIFHTTQEKSDATFFKNSTIDARNAELQKLADNETVFYIDCNPVFDDDTGALTPEYSGDGVHVKAPYYTMWRDYLFQFGVVR